MKVYEVGAWFTPCIFDDEECHMKMLGAKRNGTVTLNKLAGYHRYQGTWKPCMGECFKSQEHRSKGEQRPTETPEVLLTLLSQHYLGAPVESEQPHRPCCGSRPNRHRTSSSWSNFANTQGSHADGSTHTHLVVSRDRRRFIARVMYALHPSSSARKSS